MFDPFGKPLAEVSIADLARLSDVAEGWYVEYKRTTPNVDTIAKSLCSFANQYGGWLFLGIDERADHGGPGGFPGLDAADRVATEQRIRQAAQSCSRAPYFETHFVDGPCNDPHVSADRFIAIVRIPPSDDVPHIHKSGRIYRRIGSSSEPHIETDRALLDQLLERQKRLQEAIRWFTEFRPRLRDDDPPAHVHVYLITRRQSEYQSRRAIEFNEFVEEMKVRRGLAYDNFYTTSLGYAARTVGRELPNQPHHTLRYSADGWAHITIPLDCFDTGQAHDPRLRHLQYLRDFEAPHAIVGSKVVDLAGALVTLAIAMTHYMALLKRSGLDGIPTFYRIAVEGVWRTVPYLDMASFPAHAQQYGLGHIDRELLVWPIGDGYEGLERLNWSRDGSSGSELIGLDQATSIFSVILSLMGIDVDYIQRNLGELGSALQRRLAAGSQRR